MTVTPEFPHDLAMQVVQEIEANFDVEELQIDKICIWPIIRVALYAENICLSNNTDRKNKSLLLYLNEYTKTIIGICRIVFEKKIDVTHGLKRKKSEIYISSYTTSRTSTIDDRSHDFIFSPVVEWLTDLSPSVNVYFEEVAPKGEYRVPRYESTDYITQDLALCYLMGLTQSLVLSNSLRRKLDFEKLNSIKEFIKLKNWKGKSLSEKYILRRLSIFLFLRRYFQKKLKDLNSKIVFVVTYYSLAGMALLQAANELGLTTVDMQHGIQGTSHVAYGSWTKLPNNGYNCLPKFFWCWTEEDVNNINKWGKKLHIGLLGGNIPLAYWKNKSHPNLILLQQKIIYKKTILVTLQPGLEELVMECIKAIPEINFGDYYWLIRLHPAMLSERDKIWKLFSPFADIADIEYATSLPLPDVLSLSDYHLTCWSSVTIEADMCGVPTFIFTPECTMFSSLEQKGTVIVRNQNETFLSGMCRFLSITQAENNHHTNNSSRSKAFEVLKTLVEEAR